MIEVENLSYSYRSGRAAVQEVSFGVGEGRIFGFLGPSGAGKSTTQKILIGLLSPYQGSARVLGREVRDQGADYYEGIGVGFELPNHFVKLSALENLKFFASFHAEALDPMQLLARVGLQEAAGQRVEQFSKGMKMRLNFARALLHDPQVIFLDEPTSGLDPVNARLLKDLILAERDRGKTIFLTTHNMSDADELCDRVAFIVDGRISEVGSPAQLRRRDSRRTLTVEFRQEDEVRSAEFPLDGIGAREEFLEILRTRELVSVHSQEATLADVFMRATGRKLT